ncbi:histone-like nucleoid-structuring protein, MvaT/MvaU family [Pseudomonas rhizosphaerae]|uniref:histone-like nucleoid-structuring protein, MvaT/MvaU family n=1 Tax=Pseudomonas rhizosphaerae TaxID=216142 RepID=UPI000694A616|nr:histone-like nucleoid-structuring protein, MvaT/MvaU family [Pseudomonas rhizosphaerae]
MSRLTEYRRLEQQSTEQRSRLDELRSDPTVEKEMEFEGKLHELLYPHGKGLDDMVDRLDPRFSRVQGGQVAVPAKRSRQARRVKVYRNPLTGEIVESKGGNNRLLAAWKAQFGHEELESWVKWLSQLMRLRSVCRYPVGQGLRHL